MLQAVTDRVIVREEKAPETSAGGVFLAPAAREEPNRGLVLSVGPRVRDIKAGDRVLFTRYEGQIIPAKHDTNAPPIGPDPEDIVSLAEKEIVAVIEE